ncbi:alpha-N-arabinofuranosidase [bacterium SCN 57-13]|nr:carbohydrate binding domain-containing protein [Armatimonadota bacterium]ODU53810.1 MAG: alpha-N-arabinofuranosidase [bacterium SCN 57-13]
MILLALLAQSVTTLSLDFSKPGVAVSPTLYGLMTEEINHSYDGGLYGEQVRNRSFKDHREQAPHWRAVGEGASIALEPTGGINAAMPACLKVKGGAANEGYWGFRIQPGTRYKLSVWAKADRAGSIEASLESADGSKVYTKTTLTGVGSGWSKLEGTLETSRSVPATTDGRLVLKTGADRTTWLGMVSLFGPTFNNRPNGNRPDLMQLLADMKPKFLRFPGGNYLEGSTFKDRFNWKKTLGPIETRPGHQAPWGYRSTDGMGLLEFLEWAEDMGSEPVLGVFAGYVLNGDVIEAGTELSGFVQDALDQIEYITGGPKTKWGAQRVKDGHPKPFPLRYVEVGNEDAFDVSGSYEGRFVQFYDAIKKKYPKIKVISTTGGKDWLGRRFPITARKPDLLDEHYYSSTWEMMAMATQYDAYDRKGPKIFVGEWAAQDVPEPWKDAAKKGPTPNLKCALADAAFMTGMERNSDVVEMACYAPLLVNVNPGGRQWAVNLIGYDALSSFGSPSYYAQKMMMERVGDRTVPVSLSGAPTQSEGGRTLPGIFTSATRDTKSGKVYVKIVNALPTAQEIQFEVKGAKVASSGSITFLSGQLPDVNSIEEPFKVAPKQEAVTGLSGSFRRTVPGYSVSVLELRVNE